MTTVTIKAFEETGMWPDVKKIIEEGAKPVHYEYTAIVHTKEADLTVLKVVSIDMVRDYVNKIGDEVYIEFLMLMGVYIKKLYPFKENLELSIMRRLLLETGDRSKPNEPEEEERYKAVFLVDENPRIRTSEFEQYDINSLNIMDVPHIKLQLLNRSLEPIRVKTTGGVFYNQTAGDVLKAVLGAECLKISVDGANSISGFDLVKPDNTEVHEQILFPHLTPITDIPSFLQERIGGVYNAGIGSYIQSYAKLLTWFVYPLFNTQRFAKDSAPKAIFYSVPRNRFSGIERTYRVQSDVVHIIAAGAKAYQSHGEAEMMDQGSGYRITDSRAMMNKPVEMKDDGPVANRNTLNHEVVTIDRADGLNYAPIGNKTISSNPFTEAGRVLRRRGGRVDFNWDHADPKQLYPGMPCQFVFLNKKDEVETVDGIVLFNHIYIQMQGKGLATKAHSTSCQITLFVSNMEEEANIATGN